MQSTSAGFMGLATLLAFVANPALAGEGPAELANRALKLFSEASRQAEALTMLHDALDAAQGPVKTEIMINLGKAYGSIRRPAPAWAYLTWALERDPTVEPDVRDALSFVTDVLRVDHVRVQVATEPADALVLFGPAADRIELPAPATWWVGALDVPVLARRAGYAPRRTVLSHQGAAQVVLALEPQATVATKAARPAEAPAPKPAAPSDGGPKGSRVSTWSWAVLGAGGALALAGAGTFGGAVARASDLNGRTWPDRAAYDDDWASRVRPLEITSYVLWGVGGATALVGGVLVALDAFGADEGPRSGKVWLLPIAAPGAAGAGLGGTF